MKIKAGDPRVQGLPPEAGQANQRAALSAGNLVALTRGLAVGFKDRIFGTEKCAQAAAWLAGEMQAAGLAPANGDSYFQTFTAQVGKRELIGRNVVGLKEGTDPLLKHEVIVVAGHYDSQQDTHEGANDNATGCAGVLAIAQALKDVPTKRSILFVTFDGEEGLRVGGDYSPGRRGSRFYAAEPLFPVAKTALMVNMDELAQVHLQSGRRDHIYQWASDDPFASRILKAAFAKSGGGKAMDGYPEQPREAQFFTTDAEPLYRLGVPTINLLSGRYLENHGPEDTMKLVIPERMETYARLAGQCVLDAANHAQSLADMGVQPGGLMPSFPLVAERRGAGLAIPEEEHFRLGDLHARLPELRKACKALIKSISSDEMKARLRDVAGLELKGKLVTEPNLNTVRERWKALLDDYREIPKADIARRGEAKKALDLLAGFEGILAASLYILKLDTSSSYYMQRVPERLGELVRGARKLGLGDQLQGVVSTADTRKFKATVSADRAIEMAQGALNGLQAALSRSVFAFADRDAAAKHDRPVLADDLRAIEVEMTQAAYAALGKPDDRQADLKRTAFIGAFLDATLARVKGSGDKWLERFAEQNGMFDFGEVARSLDVSPAKRDDLLELAARVDAAIFPADLEALKPALAAFYGELTELAFGKQTNTIEELIALAKDKGIEQAMTESAANITHKVDREAIAEAQDDKQVRELRKVYDLIHSTLMFRQLFKPVDEGKWHVLTHDVSLREVSTGLGHVADALDHAGAPDLAGELKFWMRWLEPFFALEPAARVQVKERAGTAKRGHELATELWPATAERIDSKLGIDQGALKSPKGTLRALEALVREADKAEDEEKLTPELRAQRVRAEAGLKKVRPHIEALDALEKLSWSASPGAAYQLSGAVESLGNHLGEPAVKALAEVAKKLADLRDQGDVEVGRKERSGPMGVLAVRAAQKRD